LFQLVLHYLLLALRAVYIFILRHFNNRHLS
jgi:hypothetical protein